MPEINNMRLNMFNIQNCLYFIYKSPIAIIIPLSLLLPFKLLKFIPKNQRKGLKIKIAITNMGFE